jgi:hypothetical protein
MGLRAQEDMKSNKRKVEEKKTFTRKWRDLGK